MLCLNFTLHILKKIILPNYSIIIIDLSITETMNLSGISIHCFSYTIGKGMNPFSYGLNSKVD